VPRTTSEPPSKGALLFAPERYIHTHIHYPRLQLHPVAFKIPSSTLSRLLARKRIFPFLRLHRVQTIEMHKRFLDFTQAKEN